MGHCTTLGKYQLASALHWFILSTCPKLWLSFGLYFLTLSLSPSLLCQHLICTHWSKLGAKETNIVVLMRKMQTWISAADLFKYTATLMSCDVICLEFTSSLTSLTAFTGCRLLAIQVFFQFCPSHCHKAFCLWLFPLAHCLCSEWLDCNEMYVYKLAFCTFSHFYTVTVENFWF